MTQLLLHSQAPQPVDEPRLPPSSLTFGQYSGGPSVVKTCERNQPVKIVKIFPIYSL